MDKKSILSMKTNIQDYAQKALIFGIIGIPALIFGIWVLYLVFNEQVYEADVPAVLMIAIVCLLTGGQTLEIAGNNLGKFALAKQTYLEVEEERIHGCAGNVAFDIPMADIVSVTVKESSLMRNTDGVPTKMEPGISMKLGGGIVKYLCIFTISGKNYYIGTLTSPEIAKNTIDSLIAKLPNA